MKLNIRIGKAYMDYSKDNGYVGQVEFEAEHHKEPYEITLHSKDGKEWMYGLHFLNEPGPEEEIFSVEEHIDEDDDCYESLIEAAKNSMKKPG